MQQTSPMTSAAVFFKMQTVSAAGCVRISLGGRSMRPVDDKKAVRLDEEPTSETANAELIALIEHRLREPLGPTLLVLQLLLRQESLSPQGIALIRMLQRSIKEEVRAIRELLTLMRTFLEDRNKQTPNHKSDF
jgi:signal transduction histidine kinase